MASPLIGATDQLSRVRAAARFILLLLWFLACVPPHLFMALSGRSRWPRRFMRGVLRISGVRVGVQGDAPKPHTLLLANHVSWLDIALLIHATGCRLVSKAELADHPVMRWIAAQNGTILVRRSERRAVGEQADTIVSALARAQPVALFPEGTTGDGRALLPFRPALLSAVTPPAEHITVQPVAIDYGVAASEVAWPDGESGMPNAWRLLGRAKPIHVTVRLLDALPASDDRKLLARLAERAIGAALAPSAPRSPAL